MLIHQPEVEDREISLTDPDITIRSSALRDYSYLGELDDIPKLVKIAKDDTSLAIQHNAVITISDILSRHRLQNKLSRLQMRRMVQRLQTINPNEVPAVYIALGSLGHDSLIGILLTGIRNSNAEISWAATLGLTRFAISAAAIEHTELKRRVLEALGDEDIDSATRIKLTYICAAAGYFDAIELVEDYIEDEEDNEDFLNVRNELLLANKPLRGLWMSTGTDAWEYNPSIDAFTFCLIHDEQAYIKTVATNQPKVYIREGDWGDWTEYAELPKRRMWFRPLGSTERGPAVQVGERTFYPIPTEAINILLEKSQYPILKRAILGLFDVLSLRLDITISQQWLRAFMHRAHRWDAALDLRNVTEHKNSPRCILR